MESKTGGHVMDVEDLKGYFIKNLGWGWDYEARAVFEFLLEAANHCKNGVILDAGAGRKRYKPFFDDSIYISQEHEAGIELKRMKDIEYDIVNDLRGTPLKDDCLDAVLSTSVVEHLRYPAKFFEAAFRVIKPGGKLFVHVPFVYCEHEIPFDFQRPTRYGLERWFSDAGFTEVGIEPGTSSTETATYFLCTSIREDIYDRSENRIIRKLLYGLTYLPSRILRKWLKYLIDRGPHANTIFPTGWLAIGTKPGSSDKRAYRDKEEFLRLNRL